MDKQHLKDYLIAKKNGQILYAWWDEEQKEFNSPEDRLPGIPVSEVEFWFDLPNPPTA